ncbi:MAG: LacI family DNA-binding transcriptional regulator, partial [Mesorhizobium sp.]
MASRPKATILDIAREAGVSKSTVSLVLQGSGLIRPETALKVRKAIEDVGYVYNRGAANLRKAHSNVIGMVINDLTNPFFAEMAVGMERVFQSAGIVPFIANTAENPVRQEEVLKSLMEQGVAGLIVSPARGTTPGAFRRIEMAGLPIVFTFGVMLALRKRGLEPGADFAVVGFDDVIEAQHYMPALTSVAVDSAGLGERAAHVMLKMIQSRTTRAEDHIGA